jgi:predicted DNA-binding transcriptional regulator YafY
MKLTESLKTLLVEVASLQSIYDAIKHRKKCIIYYDGDEPGGIGLREIEPVALGTNKRGNLVVRAWETQGASHRRYLGTRRIPGWRFFRVDKIIMLKPTGEIFTKPRPDFNRNGDKSMKTVTIVSKF